MDEWGTAVWDTPSEPIPQPSERLVPPASPLTFHDVSEPALEPSGSLVPPTPFDDYAEAAQPADDGDFGDDFGEFDGGQSIDVEDGDMSGFREIEAMPAFTPPPPVASWEPLRLDPLPPPQELSEHVLELLAQIWTPADPGTLMTSEDIRQVEGLSQVLVAPER